MVRLVAVLTFILMLLGLALPGTVAPARAQEAPADTQAAAMDSPISYTPAEERLGGFERQRAQLEARSLVSEVPIRSVGPTVMSGRVVDVAADPDDPSHFFAAYASGGLWETTTNGQRFEPVFEEAATIIMGDIAVDWSGGGQTIWAGTGENNSSRSSYAGTGVYKSTDGGRTWQHMGLAETHRTGRIILHPEDPNTVWVAAAGHLYSPSEARGVYKTTDGGRTWQKTLYVNPRTGAIDLVIDPNDPDVLYAAMWERARRAWNFVEAGEGSGIYKSTDGGETWTRLTTEASGFPTGANVGRIGLDLHVEEEGPSVLYALLDNQNRRPEEDEEPPALTREMIEEMTRAEFLAVGEEALEDYLERNGFPAAYTAQSILEMIEDGEIEPLALVRYLDDANAQLFDTPVIGAEVYRSDDGGRTWQRTHEDYIDNMYYSYGYYFGEVRVSPQDPERVYIMGVPILRSDDGGATWQSIGAEHVHVDHHALWQNPNDPDHLIDGNDGGINISYDAGETWIKANTAPVGQFYYVQVDTAEPYNVYGGLQDNGVWVGPSTYEYDYGWYAEGDYPYERLLGGDGMQIAVDTRTNDIVYTGFQFGNYFRINRATGERAYIKPEHALGERPLRFNWQTPIHLSRHNQDILYFGSNKLHRSMDRGETWTALSGDLTQGGRPGNVPYGTLTSIDESPFRFGLLYVGSDDGLVHVSRDAGATWQNISDGLPEDLWVSRVEASGHDTSRVYVALNGYRWDNFTPYVYRSGDYGRTWERIGTELPPEPVNVILEDPHNEDVLYVGTDGGLYVSLDRGETFMTMLGTMPNAPVHDLKLQARARELVIGTHGRSIYIANVEHVEQLTPDLTGEPLHAFAIDSLRHDADWGEREAVWMMPDTARVRLPYYSSAAGPVSIRIQAEDGTVLRAMTDEAARGLNYPFYDLTVDAERAAAFVEQYNAARAEDAPAWEAADNGRWYLAPGTYTVEFERDGTIATQPLVITAPPQEGRAAPTPDQINEERGRG